MRRIVRHEWRVNLTDLAYAATAKAQFFPNLQDETKPAFTQMNVRADEFLTHITY